jgi:hypothetical protein
MAGRIQIGYVPFGLVALVASALAVGACESASDVASRADDSASKSTVRPKLTLDSGRTTAGVTRVTTRKAVKVIRGTVEPPRPRLVVQRSRLTARAGTGWFRGRRVSVRQGRFVLRLRLQRGENDFRLVARVRGQRSVVALLGVRRKARPRPQPEPTPAPTPEPTAEPTPERPPKEEPAKCDPNYEGGCLDPTSADYDCEGGSGNGPDYTGTVRVVGDDPFELDADGDGTGCDP